MKASQDIVATLTLLLALLLTISVATEAVGEQCSTGAHAGEVAAPSMLQFPAHRLDEEMDMRNAGDGDADDSKWLRERKTSQPFPEASPPSDVSVMETASGPTDGKGPAPVVAAKEPFGSPEVINHAQCLEEEEADGKERKKSILGTKGCSLSDVKKTEADRTGLGTKFTVVEQPLGVGVEIEHHYMVLSGTTSDTKKELQAGKPTLVATNWPGKFPPGVFSAEFPCLAFAVDHIGGQTTGTPIIEAVYAPVPVTSQGIEFLQELMQRVDAMCDELKPEGTPLNDFAKLANEKIFEKVRASDKISFAFEPKSNLCSANQCTVMVGPHKTVPKRPPQGFQVNLQVALKRLPDLWRLSGIGTPRIVAYVSVQVAQKLVKNEGTCDHPAFVGILSQLLMYSFHMAAKIMKQVKNMPGVLPKTTLQQELYAATYQPEQKFRKKQTGPVQIAHVEKFVKTWEGKTEQWATMMLETLESVLQQKPPELFDPQESFKWMMGVTKKKMSSTKLESMWTELQGSKVLEVVATKLGKSLGEHLRLDFAKLFYGGGGKDIVQISFAASHVTTPFWSKEAAAMCILGETRGGKDLPTVLLREGLGQEFEDLLLYMSGKDF